MKKKASMRQVAELLSQMKEGNITEFFVRRVLGMQEKKDVLDFAESLLRRIDSGEITAGQLQTLIEKSVMVYEALVDYDQPLGQMVKDGNYHWVNENVTAEHFPINGKGKKEVKLELYQFDHTVRGTEAAKRLDEAGYRPANPAELLAFGKKFPDKQRQFPIVAIGQSWCHLDGGLGVPCLCEHVGERRLYLSWLEDDFSPHCRFLVVPKAA